MDIKQLQSRWSAKQISMLLTIIALGLLAYSITQAKLDIGFYGLIHSFPITFIIALGILTVASAILWVSKENHQRLLLLQLLILVSALWLIPTLIGSPPFISSAYRNLGLAGGIAEQGSIVDSWYLAWPGAHILHAILSEVGGVTLESAMGIIPFFVQLACLIPLYVFLKNVLGETRVNYCWAGLWLFSLANWTGQEYFSPQGIALLLVLVLFALITSPSLWKEDARSLPLWLIGSVILAAITITHLLTSLAILLILAAFCLVKRAKKLAPLVVLCLVLIVCWDVTGGTHYTTRLTSEPLVGTPGSVVEGETPEGILIFDPEYIVETNVTASLSGSESHIAVVQTRIIFSLIFAVLGIVGVILVLLFRRTRTAISIFAMGIGTLLLLPLAKQFGWELVHRLYLYSLPFMAYFGAMLLDIKKRTSAIILCLLLIVSCPLSMICHYGNQSYDYFPQGQAAGLHFFIDKTGQGYVSGGSPLELTGMVIDEVNYKRVPIEKLDYQGDSLTTITPLEEKMPHYIGISYQSRAEYEFLYDDSQFIKDIEWSLQNAVNCNFIYHNEYLDLYICEED